MTKDPTTDEQGTTEEKKPTTVQEAGRMGGRRVKEKYGQSFYVDIGKKGGRMIADSRGSDYYAIIGKKGGDEVKRRHGADYYSQIGKKGGEAPRRTDRRPAAPDVVVTEE